MARARVVVCTMYKDGSPHAVLNVLKTLFRIYLPVKHMSVWGRFVHAILDCCTAEYLTVAWYY